MSYARTLNSANKQLENVVSWLNKLNVDDDILSKIIGTYTLITIEHLHSMIILAEKGRDVSLAALIRPQFESLVRGTWLVYEGTDDIAKQLINYSYEFDYLKNLCNKIDKHMGTTIFNGHREKNIDIYHGLTHSGSDMILRCVSGKNGEHIESNFTEDEVASILLSSTLNMLFMVRAYAIRIDNTEMIEKVTAELNSLPTEIC